MYIAECNILLLMFIINIKSTIPTTIMFYVRLFFSGEKELVEYFCWSLCVSAFCFVVEKKRMYFVLQSFAIAVFF